MDWAVSPKDRRGPLWFSMGMLPFDLSVPHYGVKCVTVSAVRTREEDSLPAD